jgi:NADH:ubiquinone oxidoreductase subunit 6 (subunit J)
VGVSLFGPYVLAVELASMLLLAAVWSRPSTLGREERSNRSDERE